MNSVGEIFRNVLSKGKLTESCLLIATPCCHPDSCAASSLINSRGMASLCYHAEGTQVCLTASLYICLPDMLYIYQVDIL